MFLPVGNEFVSGGLILIIFGALLAQLRNLPYKLFSLFERCFVIRLDIQEEDESFVWLKLWLAKQLEGTLSVSVLTRRPKAAPEWEDDPKEMIKYISEEADSIDRRPRVVFTPAPGWYWFFYHGKFISVTRSRTEPDGKGGMENSMRPRESFTIRVFSRNLNVAKTLVEEARDFSLPKDGKIEIRTCVNGNYWALTGRIRPRPLESVILDGDISEKVIQDVLQFQRSADWYTKLGVPYRRRYLFYGESGSGKSSFVLAIASNLGMNVNILNLSAPGMNDAKIMELLSSVDVNTIVLVEDIDCAFTKRDSGPDRKGKMDFGLTFSGILNALDGILAQDGSIVFMTTNHPEKLDEALTREGRADVKVYIGNATTEQIYRLFIRFYPNVSVSLAEKFARAIPSKEIKMAKLQHHLMKYRGNPHLALQNVEEVLKKEAYENARTSAA